MKHFFKLAAIACLTILCSLPAAAQKYMPMSMSRSLSTSYAGNDATVKMDIDYPALDEGNDKLNAAVRTWLNGQITGACNISDSVKFAYKGDLQDGDALMRYYAQAFIDQSKRDFTEYAKLQNDSSIAMHYNVTVAAKVIYETEQLVSYRVNAYSYLAGAHGAENIYYAIFRKQDGHILTWGDIMRQGAMPSFSRLMAQGVMKYLKAKTLAEAKGMSFIDKKTTLTTFPLPATNPGLTEKGIVGIYQSYEIGPYAMGHPEVTIPRASLRPLLKPMVWAFIQPWKD